MYFLDGASEMEQEFISRVGKEDQIGGHSDPNPSTQSNPAQAWTPCLKLGISAKARVHHQKVLCQKEERNPEGPNVLKILALAKKFSF